MIAAAALVPALHGAGVPCDPDGTYAFTRGAVVAEEVIVTVPDAMDRPAGEWTSLVETAVGAHYAAAGERPPAAVHVVLPARPARDGCPREDAAWMRGQAAGVASFVHDAVQTLAFAVYRRAAGSLPWRERARMDAAIPLLAADAAQRVAAGLTDPVLKGSPDAILPGLDQALQPREIRELVAQLGEGAIGTRYDVYAAVYERVQGGQAVSPAERKLYAAVFQPAVEKTFA